MRRSKSVQVARLGFRHPILWAFAGIMAIVAVVIYIVMVDAQRRIIEYEALKVAEVVARQSLAARTVYSAQVVEKLRRDGFDASVRADDAPGHVPLPAQFLKLVGKESSARSDGLFSSRPISRWNLEATQGLSDDFLRWGWGQLSRQDRDDPQGPIDWQPVWRFESVNGITTLRYLRADPASGAGCVTCHNAYERSPEIQARRVADGVTVGKQWKQHQLLGAIEVSVPVDRVEALAASQTRRTLLLVLAIAVLGLVAASGFAFWDIRRRQQISQRFAHQARHDPLTRLPNRTHFAETVAAEIERCDRDGTQFALLFVDLDRFKTINDSLGHQAGDAVLLEVACRMVGAVRGADVVSRHSGDEFTALIRDAAATDLDALTRRLMDAVAQPLQVHGTRLDISASVGVSRYPQHGSDVETLLRHADTAMYRAKQNGRNLVETYRPEMDQAVIASLALVSGMRQALEREEFELHYQPRVRVRDGAVTSVEALLRWRHPQHGLLTPDRFLAFAEEGGVIGAIGEWVLRRALTQASDWANDGLPPFRIAVNVSPHQFMSADFVERLAAIIGQSGIAPHRVELELTEGSLINDPTRVADTLARCHELGTYLSLDDFGTGYSSLAYLKRFPIDCLKIDKSFVDGLPDDANDRVLTRAIIGVARSLGLQVVAEGVETAQQLRFLKAHGCDEAQGYLHARPMPADALAELLRARAAAPGSAGPAAAIWLTQPI